MEQQQLISILQASFDAGILIDESGRILFVNTAARNFLGTRIDDQSAAAAAAVNVEDVLVFYEHINSDNDSSKKKKNAAVSWTELKNKADATFLAVCKTSSFLESKIKSAEARLSHVGNYTLLFCSLQQELMGKIEKERSIIKGILDASLDPIFQINQQGIIHLVNTAAAAQFQWTEQEFVGSNISIIVGGKHANNHDSYMKRYLETGETRVIGTKRILPAKRKDGSEFMIQLSLVEVETEGKAAALLSTTTMTTTWNPLTSCLDRPIPVGDERLFCGFVMDLPDLQQWVEEDPCDCCCCWGRSGGRSR